jgi:hypothetical protein
VKPTSRSPEAKHRQHHIGADDYYWLPSGHRFIEDVGLLWDNARPLPALDWLADNVRGQWYWFARNHATGKVVEPRVRLYVLLCDVDDALLYRLSRDAKPIALDVFGEALSWLSEHDL